MLRQHSWNAVSQDELKVGRHTVRLKRSLGEGGFAFIHLVEVSALLCRLVFFRNRLCCGERRRLNSRYLLHTERRALSLSLLFLFSLCV